jgi:hypothetical protein
LPILSLLTRRVTSKNHPYLLLAHWKIMLKLT